MRFRVWELAQSVIGSRDVASVSEMIQECSKRGIDIELVRVAAPESPATFALNVSNKFFIAIGTLDDADDTETHRKWFSGFAHVLFHCLTRNQRRTGLIETSEEAANYFAQILSSHWNGRSGSSGNLGPNDLGAMVLDSHKILQLVKRLRKNRVLVLGKYPGEGGKRLRLIESHLQALALTPIIFGDLASVHGVVQRGAIREEVLTVAKLCEFVIVEDSEASGHLLEIADLGTAMVRTAFLRERGMGSTLLTESFFRKYGHFMKEFGYSQDTIAAVMTEVLEWARKMP